MVSFWFYKDKTSSVLVTDGEGISAAQAGLSCLSPLCSSVLAHKWSYCEQIFLMAMQTSSESVSGCLWIFGRHWLVRGEFAGVYFLSYCTGLWFSLVWRLWLCTSTFSQKAQPIPVLDSYVNDHETTPFGTVNQGKWSQFWSWVEDKTASSHIEKYIKSLQKAKKRSCAYLHTQ